MIYEDLIQSGNHVINGVVAEPIENYVGPAYDELLSIGDGNVLISVSNKNEIEDRNNNLVTSYGRILMETEVPNSRVLAGTENHSNFKLGFAMKLVVNKKAIEPHYISYGGHEVLACTNFTVMSDRNRDAFSNSPYLVMDNIKRYEASRVKDQEHFVQFVESSSGTQVDEKEVSEIIGDVVLMSHHKSLGFGHAQHAVKELYSKNGVYRIKNGVTTLWNVYSAITSFMSKKNNNGSMLMEKADFSLAITDLFYGYIK